MPAATLRIAIAAAVLVPLACGGGSDSPAPSSPSSPTSPTNTAPGPVASVTIAGASSIVVGGSVQLSVTLKDASGRTTTGGAVAWSTTDTTLARISLSGLLTGVFPGGATVAATVDGVTGTLAVPVRAPTLTARAVTGLTAHFSVHVNDVDYMNTFAHGFSYYSSVAPINPTSAKDIQLGWGVWITPNNQGITVAGNLCQPNWGIYQSLEGGVGTWGSVRFPGTSPKFLIVATGDCYQQGVSSPGYNNGSQLPANKLGLAQLNNRVVIPPDYIQFAPGADNNTFLGYGWIALPIIPATTSPLGIATGNQNWTLFLNTTNFKGPLAFWVPEYWTSVDAIYPNGVGRGLDSRPALNGDLGLEVGFSTSYTATDSATGIKYKRIPKLALGAVGQRATLLRDARYYNKTAIFDLVEAWMNGGAVPAAFNVAGTMLPDGFARTSPNATMSDDGKAVNFDGKITVVKTPSGGSGLALGLDWTSDVAPGALPEYYQFDGTAWKAIPESSVPRRTWLTDQTFPAFTTGSINRLDVSATSPWTSTGWAAGPFTTQLNNGSTVEYVWYKFTEQPAIKRLNLDAATKARLQTWVEDMHLRWGTNGPTIPAQTSGSLATLDGAMFVTPPAGLERGYVPIAIRQY